MSKPPNCYECVYREEVPGSCHSSCNKGMESIFGNDTINVTGNEHGIKKGWFYFPFNFDPVWLESCDGFESRKK